MPAIADSISPAPGTLPPAIIGVPYSQTFTATYPQATPGVLYELNPTSLPPPPGLVWTFPWFSPGDPQASTLTATISGTPTATGIYQFDLFVLNLFTGWQTYLTNGGYTLFVIARAIPFASVGQTRNQIATGGGLDSMPPLSPLIKGLVQLNAASARGTLDQLSGEVHASVKGALIEVSRFVRNAALDRLTDAFCLVGHIGDRAHPETSGSTVAENCMPNPDRFTAWGHAFGSWGHTGSDGNAASLSRSLGGFIAGIDASLAEDWRAGLLLGYARSSFSVDRRASSGSSNDYTIGLYGGRQWGAWDLKLGAAYTWHDIETDRTPLVAGLAPNRLGSSYHAGTAQAFGELGYRLGLGNVDLQPFANLALVNQHVGSFREEGGPAALSGQSSDQTLAFSTLGLHLATHFELGTVPVTARATLGWQHAFGKVAPATAMAFSDGSPFTIRGLPLARDAAVIDAGLDFQLARNTVLNLSYGAQFARKSVDQSVRGTLSLSF